MARQQGSHDSTAPHNNCDRRCYGCDAHSTPHRTDNHEPLCDDCYRKNGDAPLDRDDLSDRQLHRIASHGEPPLVPPSADPFRPDSIPHPNSDS